MVEMETQWRGEVQFSSHGMHILCIIAGRGVSLVQEREDTETNQPAPAMPTDLQLLSQYHQRGDALAFRDLMKAHAGMVLATARRITRDAAMAEDVAQETFLQLARQSRQITESVAAWLHRVAWRRACNAVREDATRRRYEEGAAAESEPEAVAEPGSEASWSEVEAELDAVIDALPENLRGPLVMHYLQDRPQREIAKSLGVNQSTVSRAIEEGLGEVRARLKNKGVLCGAGLGAMLAAQAATAAAQPVPAGLLAALGKLGISGIGGGVLPGAVVAGTAAAGAAAGGGWLALSMDVKLAAAASVLLAGGAAAILVPGWLQGRGEGVKGNEKLLPAYAMHSPEGIRTPKNGRDGKVVAKGDGAVQTGGQGAGSAAAATAAMTVALSQEVLERVMRSRPAGGGTGGQRAKSSGGTSGPGMPGPVEAVSGAPVHELVHSFPTPPQRPSGRLVQDGEGWFWGTTSSGGSYGQGTIFKMRADGGEWQEMAGFNGVNGTPAGSYPMGLTEGPDGCLWGVTGRGGERDGGTLFRYDPRKGELETMAEFASTGRGAPAGRPVFGADGALWGTATWMIYKFDPATRKLSAVLRTNEREGTLRGLRPGGALVADGRGFLWGTVRAGAGGHGALYKVNLGTGEAVVVARFTGRNGPVTGSEPAAALTPDGQGNLWGTTRNGGQTDDGTLFKIAADSGVLTTVAEFRDSGPGLKAGERTGSHPETALAMDGAGAMWGTTSYGGARSNGTVFKVDLASGRLTRVLAFTGEEGEAPGGPARGDLMADGAGGMTGVCDFGGAGNVGTFYRVEIATGRYTLLKDISDLARNTEGSEPHGKLTAGRDGWLWGVTQMSGAHHCGTIYKFNPVTDELVSVVDFTGRAGPHKGRYAAVGLAADGQGFLWGTTMGGGSSGGGTLYKVEERTGAFTTVKEFNRETGMGSLAALAADGRGFLWGCTLSTVFKVEARSHAFQVVARFYGDTKAPYGSEALGTPAMDDQGFLWGCALADRTHKRGSVYKIDTATDAFTVVAELDDANAGWQGWHPTGSMHWDGKGSMWFTGVLSQGGPKARCSLARLNTRTGRIEQSWQAREFPMLASPFGDENGVLRGMTAQDRGRVYTFDPATGKFGTFLTFSGAGAQPLAGSQPQVAQFMKHTDGNLYAVTRYGGPGNGGTVYRLRHGPTPMTQEAVLLADGRASLHGTVTPNGLDSTASFEWGTDAELKGGKGKVESLAAGVVGGGDAARPVTAMASGLKPGATYYFRVVAANAANPVPQRGAVRSFTMPVNGDAALLAAAGTGEGAGSEVGSGEAGAGAGAESGGEGARRYELRVNRIPGAGAGRVTGVLSGSAYEIGKRYSLTALPDNDYIFDHWSGPGISGARAEGARLDFVFTEALAKAPVITATFVRNPFRGGATGLFHGLLRPATGIIADASSPGGKRWGGTVLPDLSNTGALRLVVTRTGTFTGALRFDGVTLPLAGAFDMGGVARFGARGRQEAGLWIERGDQEKTLLLTLLLELNPEAETNVPVRVTGALDRWEGSRSTWVEHGTIEAARSAYDGRTRLVPGHLLATAGAGLVIEEDAEMGGGAGEGTVRVFASGRAVLAARLGDGTRVVSESPLSARDEAAFFAGLSAQAGRPGVFGGVTGVGEEALALARRRGGYEFWWGRPVAFWREVRVKGREGR